MNQDLPKTTLIRISTTCIHAKFQWNVDKTQSLSYILRFTHKFKSSAKNMHYKYQQIEK